MGQLLLIARGTASFWSLWITQSFLVEAADGGSWWWRWNWLIIANLKISFSWKIMIFRETSLNAPEC